MRGAEPIQAENGTALGDAIARSLTSALEPRQAIEGEGRPRTARARSWSSLLSDGASTTGDYTPLEAAQLAKDADVPVYTVALGTAERHDRSGAGRRRRALPRPARPRDARRSPVTTAASSSRPPTRSAEERVQRDRHAGRHEDRRTRADGVFTGVGVARAAPGWPSPGLVQPAPVTQGRFQRALTLREGPACTLSGHEEGRHACTKSRPPRADDTPRPRGLAARVVWFAVLAALVVAGVWATVAMAAGGSGSSGSSNSSPALGGRAYSPYAADGAARPRRLPDHGGGSAAARRRRTRRPHPRRRRSRTGRRTRRS